MEAENLEREKKTVTTRPSKKGKPVKRIDKTKSARISTFYPRESKLTESEPTESKPTESKVQSDEIVIREVIQID